jgi:hypothetical protein
MDSRYRRRRWARGLLTFVAGVLVLMAAGLAVNAKLDAGQQPEAFPPTALPVPPWDATTSPSPDPAGSPMPSGPVRIIQGAQLVDGVYLGFPHTTAGAVSAAAEFAALMLSTLDPARAATVMRVAADPSFTAAPQEAALGAVSDRESLGLPASGPVPDGYSFTVAPVECQVREAGAGRETVLLLAEFTSLTPGQGIQVRAGVFPVALRWSASAGDWKVLPTPANDYSSLAAEPDSPQAAALGWLDLQP